MTQTNRNLICNGEFEIVKITESLYKVAVELYEKHFIPNENICIATDLTTSQDSIDDMTLIFTTVLKDGLSFAARHCETQKLVAMCVNKILCPSRNCNLEETIKKCKSQSIHNLGEYVSRMEDTIDLYKKWNIDCVLEIFFLSTHPDFGKRGLAYKLSEFSIEYARKLMNGTVPDEDLPEHVRGFRPKAVCSLFSSRFTQRVGEKLGMETINKVPYTEFSFNGKTFAEKIDPIHEFSVFAALKL